MIAPVDYLHSALLGAILAVALVVAVRVTRSPKGGGTRLACPRCGGDVELIGSIDGLAWDGKLYNCLDCGQRFRMEERHGQRKEGAR